MHTNDKRVYNLSDSTYIALDTVEAISLEVDIFSIFESTDTRQGGVNMKYDREGEPYTNTREGTSTAYGDEDGMPQPLDAFFQQYCYNSGKDFKPLETVDFQENMLSGSNMQLDWSHVGFEHIVKDKDEMIEVYLTGNIYALDRLLKSSLSMFPKLYDEIIIKRNLGMADKLDSLIQVQSMFCAVGAGHLAGGAGIINLLVSKGYSVRKVLATYSDNESETKKAVKSFRTYKYDNDTLGFHGIFPGKPIIVEDELNDNSELHLIYCDLGQGNTFEIEVYYREEGQNLEHVAEVHIASPSESPYEKVVLDTGDELYQGLGETYWDGVYWVRVIMAQDVFIVMKAYGGNKFMNSPRAYHFFDQVWLD